VGDAGCPQFPFQQNYRSTRGGMRIRWLIIAARNACLPDGMAAAHGCSNVVK
jgi:hypothetical protein